jgi:hypothetical protein
MIKYSLSEIVEKAKRMRYKKEKISWLRENDSVALRKILQYMYDKKNIQFLLPDAEPPYNPSKFEDSRGLLYSEIRRLRIFIKGMGYDNLNQTKREALFISLLEDIHREDAQLLVDMITKRGYKELSVAIINESFPGLIEVENKEETKNG